MSNDVSHNKKLESLYTNLLSGWVHVTSNIVLTMHEHEMFTGQLVRESPGMTNSFIYTLLVITFIISYKTINWFIFENQVSKHCSILNLSSVLITVI